MTVQLIILDMAIVSGFQVSWKNCGPLMDGKEFESQDTGNIDINQ